MDTLCIDANLASVFSSHQRYNPRGKWEGVFDAMAWLYSPHDLNGEFSLELHYSDSVGRRHAPIDTCLATGRNIILLTNRKTLSIDKTATDIQLIVRGDADELKQIKVLESHVCAAKLSVSDYMEQSA